MVGSIIRILLEIYFSFQQRKENRLRFDLQSYLHKFGVLLFGNTMYTLSRNDKRGVTVTVTPTGTCNHSHKFNQLTERVTSGLE